jgi:hypothetical protein
MSNELSSRNQELYLVEVDGIKKSEHRVFIQALKCGMELKRRYPRSEVKLRDAGENVRLNETRTWAIGRSSAGREAAELNTKILVKRFAGNGR